MRHLLQMVDALLVSNDTKTISGLYRLLKGQPDPKTGADFLRESPWEPQDVSSPRKRWMVNKFRLSGSLRGFPHIWGYNW
jgi:hypothetical protein